MANEYLQRTPTSTGNRRVWTWSTWVKRNSLTSTNQNLLCSTEPGLISKLFFNTNDKLNYQNNSPSFELITSQTFRDVGNWFHILFVAETTASISSERIRIYVNGVRITKFDTETYPSINSTLIFNYPIAHFISKESSATNWFIGEFADVFFIDGQALTPDVFGFYKQGKGYISAGSTQATDFRPGQWVPKTPRVIKTEINRRGGFGVNGFYLPMNDSKNFGADFHCDPNSIITLNEKLPQPRVGVATTASVGLGYTDALRADPYAANLVLALPFVSGGLSSGFGDYSAAIRGNGNPKTITNSNVSIATTAGYYGSAALFNGSNAYLSIPSNSDFGFGTGNFTIDFWMNLNATTDCHIWEGRDGTNVNQLLIRLSSGTIRYYGNGADRIVGTALNTSQWNHIAVSRNNTTSQLFVNGVCVGINTADTINYVSAASTVFIGTNESANNRFLNGYIQDLRIYKGVAKYTGGFDVPRPYTPVGIATWRAVPDTTANNFCTWNPLYPGWTGSAVENAEFTNGNLTVSESSANISQGSATIGVSTGKWYYEAIPSLITSANSNLIGIRPAEWFTFNQQNRTSWRNGGAVYDDAGGTAQSGTTYTTTDIIGIAFDMNNRRLWFSKNGSWVYSGDPNNNLNPAVSFASTYTHYTPFFAFDNVGGTESWTANFGQNPTFSGNTTAGTFTDSNGKGLFKYQPPSGFLALCEDNLPTPAISNPGQYFKTVLYTGDGNNLPIVGVGFTPDLIWTKARSAVDNNVLVDQIRGPRNILISNQTTAESDYSAFVSFNNDGFTKASTESVSGRTYVAWCWRAGAGTTSTNTNGSITSVVSVNQDAGFSIVSYTGNGSSTATVGHGLGKTPAFLISKARGGTNDWWVVHKSGNGNLQLNTTSALITSGGTNGAMGFPSTLTSSTFTFTNGSSSVNNVNQNGITYVTYCWAEIEGYSKFGSWIGNNSTDGPFVYCGFKPAFVLIKNINAITDWLLHDSSRTSTNPSTKALKPNSSQVEIDISGTTDIDFLSNGFKIRNSDGGYNSATNTYIFAAFAESPFSYSNSK